MINAWPTYHLVTSPSSAAGRQVTGGEADQLLTALTDAGALSADDAIYFADRLVLWQSGSKAALKRFDKALEANGVGAPHPAVGGLSDAQRLQQLRAAVPEAEQQDKNVTAKISLVNMPPSSQKHVFQAAREAQDFALQHADQGNDNFELYEVYESVTSKKLVGYVFAGYGGDDVGAWTSKVRVFFSPSGKELGRDFQQQGTPL